MFLLLYNIGKNNYEKESRPHPSSYRHLKKLCTAEIPILPDTYMGTQIAHKESICYVDKGINDERGCHQYNNLIYSAQQMPDREKGVVCNKGWGKVICKPKRISRKAAQQRVTGFTIQTPLQS